MCYAPFKCVYMCFETSKCIIHAAGIVIDAFGGLRDERDAAEDDLQTTCFVCNLDRCEREKERERGRERERERERGGERGREREREERERREREREREGEREDLGRAQVHARRLLRRRCCMGSGLTHDKVDSDQ